MAVTCLALDRILTLRVTTGEGGGMAVRFGDQGAFSGRLQEANVLPWAAKWLRKTAFGGRELSCSACQMTVVTVRIVLDPLDSI